MPTWEVELSAEDLALLGITNASLVETKLSELISQALSDLAEDASFYPELAPPIRRARLRLVVERETD